MGRYLDRQNNMQAALCNDLHDLYIRAEMFGLDHASIAIASNALFSARPRMNGNTRRHCMGYETALRNALYRVNAQGYTPLVFAYVYDGKILPIDCAEYRALSPCDVATKSTHKGHYWRLSLKPFFTSDHKG